jgi:hypothetical protein
VQQFNAAFDPDSGSIHRILHPSVVQVADGREGGGPVLRLDPAAPNPARGATWLAFYLPRAARTDAVVKDLQGRKVRVLLAGAPLGAGRQTASWDGRDGRGRPAPSGVYLIEVSAGGERTARRVVLTR